MVTHHQKQLQKNIILLDLSRRVNRVQVGNKLHPPPRFNMLSVLLTLLNTSRENRIGQVPILHVLSFHRIDAMLLCQEIMFTTDYLYFLNRNFFRSKMPFFC